MDDEILDTNFMNMPPMANIFQDSSLNLSDRDPFDSSMLDVDHFDCHDALDNIESVNRELNELQEKLLKTSVRAHMLEVDLATQFNPETFLEIRQADLKCGNCAHAMAKLEKQAGKCVQEIETILTTKDNEQSSSPTSPTDEKDEVADVLIHTGGHNKDDYISAVGGEEINYSSTDIKDEDIED